MSQFPPFFQLPETTPTSAPPLDNWQPAETVAFPIYIDDRGEWYHEGDKITRQSLVRLFASVLWGQDDGRGVQFFLKTPSHLYQIDVADAPLIIVGVNQLSIDGQTAIAFISNRGDELVLNDEHIPYFAQSRGETAEWRAYVPMRYRLFAKIARSAFYHLLEMGQLTDGDDGIVLTLQSLGKTYTLAYPAGAEL